MVQFKQCTGRASPTQPFPFQPQLKRLEELCGNRDKMPNFEYLQVDVQSTDRALEAF